MPSQLDLLRQSLARLEQEHGTDIKNPFIQGLRMQIMAAERAERRRQTGGFFDEDGKIKPEWQNPMG
jgi:hypothetical protein